jgi:hypothetical protein
MQTLGHILRKKLSRGKLKEVALLGVIKESAEHLFKKKGLNVRVLSYNNKDQTLLVKVSHSSQARELLGYHDQLNDVLKKQDLPPVKKIQPKL